jgi:hypothetical protein
VSLNLPQTAASPLQVEFCYLKGDDLALDTEIPMILPCLDPALSLGAVSLVLELWGMLQDASSASSVLKNAFNSGTGGGRSGGGSGSSNGYGNRDSKGIAMKTLMATHAAPPLAPSQSQSQSQSQSHSLGPTIANQKKRQRNGRGIN